MINAKRFRNDVLGQGKGGSGKHSLTIKKAKMLKKIACLAVYQIGAFAFVRDVDFFLKKCSPYPAWTSVIVRLQDEVYGYAVSAVSDHLPEDIDIPSLIRSKVLESTGYVVLCKFLVLSVNTVAKVVTTTDSAGIMPIGEYPSVPDAPVLLPAMDDRTQEISVLQPIVGAALQPIFEKTLQDLERVLRDLFGVFTTATANNVRSLGEKEKARASSKKRASTFSEKRASTSSEKRAPVGSPEKQARVSSKKPATAAGSPGKRASALSEKPAPAVSSGKRDIASLKKPTPADSRKRASTSSEKSSPAAKKKPKKKTITAVHDVEVFHRPDMALLSEIYHQGDAEAEENEI